MANQSAKRIVQQNATRLDTLKKLFLGINAFYLLTTLLFQRSSLTWTTILGYILKVTIESLLFISLRNSARPRYDPGGTLVDSGTDLGQPGLVQYMFDYLYVMWFVRILGLVTRWAWIVYLVFPAYLVYAFGPQIAQLLGVSRAVGTGETAAEEEDAAKIKKRQEKKERKQQRVRYARH